MTMTATGHGKAGRPSKNAAVRHYYDSALYPALAAGLPQHVERGKLNVANLAAAIGVSTQTLYRSMANDRVSPELARHLINESAKTRVGKDKKLTIETLARFLMR